MADSRIPQGPGKSVLNTGQRILTLLVGIAETRLRLAIVELEEEKSRLFRLLLATGLTLLFTAFGLMSLLVMIIWAVDPQYRLQVLIWTTAILFVLAIAGGLWTLSAAKRSTLLFHSRQELKKDRDLLEDDQ
ncbi:phage holin family protein [Shimwellia blattae]|uniref:Conserved inner membrane protein n=1 Tax=Shimwellia blattae (strain ATCC 29907 / DSM 4481 / JCM 1650 / NBRC 105725 / CDC 9005-74) TaxID=630626 RepID=I2B4X7_SHIBC|nr:phage holin family protein [Shimwellia blattae]AFJ45581.1 conserved inner membrane protein [Shimwellia blattae DSM 4481 = NBRC 105725]GAB81479.1 hypothetical protein YqjE [Shimwellia blattae DSM 4481 = NBRC 105725]VDY63062.1 Inner membrane protein yqjE [Shimwellia blattae]VEC20225.1 Inner membrane protein yqjE [Shimwellia blattae]